MPKKTRPPHPELAQLGRRIREMRERLALSQDALGVDRSQVSRIESGSRSDPSISQVVAIAEALGVSIDFLALGRERVAGSQAALVRRADSAPVQIVVATDTRHLAQILGQFGQADAHIPKKLGRGTKLSK